MSPPTLAFLKVDARRPLDDASETLDDQNSKGFVKLAATIDPKFTGAHVAYDVMIASKATHVNVMASTLVPGCKISIDGVTGNMATRPASGPVSIVVESSSGEMTTYTLTVKVSSEMSNEGEVVMKEKPKVENAEPEHHGHSHDGVPCDGTHHSHGHSHDDKKAKCEHSHGDGEECHGHGHEEKHSHGHGHEEKHSHGHGHEEKHSHGHGHEEKHSHGHGHEEKHSHGHGH